MNDQTKESHLPPSSLTEQAHPDLEKNSKLRLKYDGPFSEKEINLPMRADYLCDGHRLLIENPSSLHINLALAAFISLIFAFISGFLTLTFYILDEKIITTFTSIIIYFGITFFIASIVFYIFFKKIGASNFYIFDRDTGNVKLPKKFRCSSFVMPFSELQLFAIRAIGRHGLNQYRTYLYPKVKPKGQCSRRRYNIYFAAGVINATTAEPYWNFISLFMDKTQEIPNVYFIRQQLEIYKTYNKTFDDLPFEKFDEEAMETLFYDL